MSNTLTNILVTTKPRETSGSRSSNRFDYQKNWALCELLTLHIDEEDYLLILDYHEDVVVLNSEREPTSVDFFQIKSKKSGNWTVNALTKHDGSGHSGSIFGKLFSNYKMCPEHAKSLVFVSNQGLSTNLADGKKALQLDVVEFSQLTIQDKEKIHKSIEGNKAKFCDIAGLVMLTVSKTELGVSDHVAYTKGKLVEFFESIHPTKNVSVSLAYKTLFDEIRRRTNKEAICESLEDLCTNKGIGRKEFGNMIDLFIDHTSAEESWREVQQLLISEDYKVSEIRGIKASWRKYAVERMDICNEPLLSFRKSICGLINEFETSNPQYDLRDLLDSVKPHIDSDNVPNLSGESFIIEAAIIYEVMTNDPIQKTDKKPKEEAV